MSNVLSVLLGYVIHYNREVDVSTLLSVSLLQRMGSRGRLCVRVPGIETLGDEKGGSWVGDISEWVGVGEGVRRVWR